MSDKQTTEIDWHAHGLAWALADAMKPGGSEEWTAADLARAYEAGAKQALAAAGLANADQAMAVIRQIASMPRRTREQRLAKSCVDFLDSLRAGA